MWFWIVAGIILLGLVVFLLLLVPVHAVLDVDTAARRKFHLRVSWLFGLIRKDLPRSRKAGEKPRLPRFRSWLSLMRSKGMVAGIHKFAKEIFSRFNIQELDIRVRLGMADPFSTAALVGIAWGVRRYVKLPPRYRMDIQPTFATSTFFEGNVHLNAVSRPIRILLPVARFWLSSPGRKAIRLAFSEAELPPDKPRTMVKARQ